VDWVWSKLQRPGKKSSAAAEEKYLQCARELIKTLPQSLLQEAVGRRESGTMLSRAPKGGTAKVVRLKGYF